MDGLNQFRDTPFGKVRINAPNSIAPFVLGPVIGTADQGQSQPRTRDHCDETVLSTSSRTASMPASAWARACATA